ncbi:arylsulfatase B-like [Ostrea edulis]|uniref:arylsulfatase B-like n=1 Tax=Ostrea edulis TaxID=37623 RepID=UPI0024AF7052|nr:arylsulfatase B-like [Ostrea edulis]
MDILKWTVLWFLMVCQTNGNGAANQKPHIFFITVDDMGNNDIGYNNAEVQTPNIDGLAKAGVILDSNYVYPVCTPSRAAFMTGRYAHKIGLQHGVIEHNQPAYINNTFKTVAEKLTTNYGYAAHMIGKWHLGNCKDEVTPTYRGFNSFYGFYGGAEHYYTYKSGSHKDFRDNLTAFDPQHPNYPSEDVDGYSTFEYVKRAIKLVENHDKSQPLFMYLAFQAPHSRLMAPQYLKDKYPGTWTYTDRFGSTVTADRSTFYAMVTAVDEAIGELYSELDKLGLLENAIIAFTSDNGGQPAVGGFNNPYRGTKGSYYEGGIRVPGFIYSKTLLTQSGYRSQELMHASDWMPTFISLAGGSADLTSDSDLVDIDGVDETQMLLSKSGSARSKIFLNIDEVTASTTIYGVIKQYGSEVWKYVQGDIGRRNIVYTATKVSRKRTFMDRLEDLLKRSRSDRTKRAKRDKYLFKISDDVTESTNWYNDPDPNIQTIQTDLENEIAAEINNAVSPMNLYSCSSPNNSLNGFWTAGAGNGWCDCTP